MRNTMVRWGAAIALVTPMASHAQTRGFVVKLGTDTLAVEQVTRTGDRVEGRVVRHLQGPGMLLYVITFNKDGTVATYDAGSYRLDGSPALPNPQTGISQVGQKMWFTADSVIREVRASGQPSVRRTAVPKGTLPAIGGGSWYFNELLIQAAKRDGKANVIGFGATANAATSPDVRLVGADSAESVASGFRTGFKLDRGGQLVHGDGSLSTQKFDVRPVRDPDLTAIASAWAAQEPPGQPAGPLSTADTVNADVAGAHVTITYGRPAARGREIWGKLVPYDTTWRLGANFATQLKTDRDLDVGGKTVPAGQYTLWLLPTAGQSFLIVNKRTKDPADSTGRRALWGTGWDPADDLVRVPLEKHARLPTAEERFHIFIQGDMLMLHWDRSGYGVRLKAK